MAELISRLTQILVPKYWEPATDRVHKLTPALVAELPKRSHLARGAGRLMEPLNLILVGQDKDLVRTFKAAGWKVPDHYLADNIMRALVCSMFNSPYPKAPVTPLFVNGRVQRFTFEKPAASNSIRQRHIVRVWSTDHVLPNGHPVWIASATYASGVRLTWPPFWLTTRTDTHLDNERAYVRADLLGAGARDRGMFKLHGGSHDTINTLNAFKDLLTTDGRASALEV